MNRLRLPGLPALALEGVPALARAVTAALALAVVLALAPGCSAPTGEEAVRLAGYRPATAEGLEASGWRTDLSRLGVPVDAIRTASLAPALFVPIRAPRHAPAAAVDLDPAEPVLVARGPGEVRAWPLGWLLKRELALDDVGGVPVAVTFCSLCSTARIQDRRLDGEVLELAVSGLLVEGNSLLFDRRTESLWRQIDGVAIAGAHEGRRLAEFPSFVLSFGELRRARPDALVMLEPEPASSPRASDPTAADPPFARLAAEDLARGEPPAWLALSCPRPFEPTLALDAARTATIAVAGSRVENLPGLVVLRDPACAAPYRDTDGRAGPITGSAAVFRRELDGRALTFEWDGAGVVDRETGSRWNLLGEARDGPLAGRSLEVVSQIQGFRYALAGS